MPKKWIKLIVEYLEQRCVKFDGSDKEYVEWYDIRNAFLYANERLDDSDITFVSKRGLKRNLKELKDAVELLQRQLEGIIND